MLVELALAVKGAWIDISNATQKVKATLEL
jgi:hypothetical protein